MKFGCTACRNSSIVFAAGYSFRAPPYPSTAVRMTRMSPNVQAARSASVGTYEFVAVSEAATERTGQFPTYVATMSSSVWKTQSAPALTTRKLVASDSMRYGCPHASVVGACFMYRGSPTGTACSTDFTVG